MQGCDIVGVQLSILTGVRREGVHSGVIHLQTTISGNPQVADLIRTEGIDVIVDQRLHAVLGQGVDRCIAIQDTCQSVAF